MISCISTHIQFRNRQVLMKRYTPPSAVPNPVQLLAETRNEGTHCRSLRHCLVFFPMVPAVAGQHMQFAGKGKVLHQVQLTFPAHFPHWIDAPVDAAHLTNHKQIRNQFASWKVINFRKSSQPCQSRYATRIDPLAVPSARVVLRDAGDRGRQMMTSHLAQNETFSRALQANASRWERRADERERES